MRHVVRGRELPPRSPRSSIRTRRARAAGACLSARRSRTTCRTPRRGHPRPRAPGSHSPRPRTPRPDAYVRSAESTAIGCTRALRRRSVSASCAATFAVPSEPGAITPIRVIVARLRMRAVIGMSSRSASQTLDRCQVLRAGAPRAAGRTRARARPSPRSGRTPERGRSPRSGGGDRQSRLRERSTRTDERARPTQRATGCRHRSVVRGARDGAGRGGSCRLAAGTSRPGRRARRRLVGVPASDRPPQRAAPAAEALDEAREPKQVRSRPSHLRQRCEGACRVAMSPTPAASASA